MDVFQNILSLSEILYFFKKSIYVSKNINFVEKNADREISSFKIYVFIFLNSDGDILT